MKGLGALQRHQLPHPPCKNPGSATANTGCKSTPLVLIGWQRGHDQFLGGGGGGGDDVNNILAYSPNLSSLPVSASAQPGVMSVGAGFSSWWW